MVLPKIDVPTFELMLPLSKKSVMFRPFLVKEEKILLMAMESDDIKTINNSIKQIVSNCCLDEIDVDEIPILDLEFMFINLRARSVGEKVELQYKCNNTIKDEQGNEKKCGNVVDLEVNLLEVTPEFSEDHTNNIDLGNNIGIVMKYPVFSSVSDINEDTPVQQMMSVLIDCVDYVYDEDNIYYRKDITDKEMESFLDNLTQKQFKQIEQFFTTIPILKKDVEFKCKKCGYEEKITVSGINNFFV